MKYLCLFLISFGAFSQDPLLFNNESNLSIIQTGGNSNVETYDAKTESYFKNLKREYNFGGHYILSDTKVTQDGEKINKETARNWDLHGQYTQTFAINWGGFVSVKVESDKFSGYEQRNNYDLGSRYTLSKTDQFESFFEVGYRYTEEIPVANARRDNTARDNKGRLYFQVTNSPDKHLIYKFWIEYIPNFTRNNDYLISTAPSLTTTLSDTFSLQVAYKVIYDNEPAIKGNKYTDYTFTTSLVAKF